MKHLLNDSALKFCIFPILMDSIRCRLRAEEFKLAICLLLCMFAVWRLSILFYPRCNSFSGEFFSLYIFRGIQFSFHSLHFISVHAVTLLKSIFSCKMKMRSMLFLVNLSLTVERLSVNVNTWFGLPKKWICEYLRVLKHKADPQYLFFTVCY